MGRLERFIEAVKDCETPALECEECGEGIYLGDRFYSIEGVSICTTCMSGKLKTADMDHVQYPSFED